jgi:hypothetical protein
VTDFLEFRPVRLGGGRSSFPNADDDLRSQIAYTVGAEFSYRLDQFLEARRGESEDGSVQLAVVATVQQCSLAVLDLLGQLDWGTGCNLHPFESPSSANATASNMSAGAVQVLNDMLQHASDDESASCAQLPKWKLMCIVSGEFFLRLGAMAEVVLARSRGFVEERDVLVLLGCIDAAMGMLYELAEVTWATSMPVPARAILAVHGHVISNSLFFAGEEAVALIEEVYQVVVDNVMGSD